MKDHKDKGILQIDYNFLNLPSLLIFNQTYIPRVLSRPVNIRAFYQYSASGEKLRKMYVHKNPAGSGQETVTTDYLNGFQYESKQINSTPVAATLKFVPTAEGYYDFEKNQYIYSYTDHLGNIRVSYFKNTNGSAEVLEENNFYPFGMKHEGYNQTAGNPAYSYQYNGKELQKETGWSDYGARMYMSDIARWGVIDPLAEQMRRYSPYTYAYNNPVSNIDPDGRKPLSWDAEQANIMYKVVPEGSLWWVYASGSHVGAGMQGGGDGIGDFFGQMKVRSGGGGGGSSATDPTPKTGPNLIQRIGNFLSNLFGGKKSTASGHNVKATVVDIAFIPEGVATESSEAAAGTGLFSTAGLTAGAIFVPTMIKEPEFNWTRQFDVPTDIPITTTGDPKNNPLYLYRNMLAVGNIPVLGQNRFTLGIRPLDIGGKIGTEYVYPSSLEGLSTTLEIGNAIPPNVPNATDKTTLFRINAALLPAQGLIPAPIEGNYYRVIPAYRMTAQEFNFRIQATAPLWTPAR
ncbi:RHS repeat-associated core domain-containing protein [Chryseobacterium sp. PS-8]|uniref:RHS repeat-associated core domain-containing protein n=2 Tax=Chryseobacterium indicum TaxID=2766954 RepID=A0ABS9C4F6_9FLAO|nr:RHS repeat-associated core domain-containing protein [Chryseobacterium sp. PS-8]